jgi:hypothetical protein
MEKKKKYFEDWIKQDGIIPRFDVDLLFVFLGILGALGVSAL